jgi:hypothetical protein
MVNPWWALVWWCSHRSPEFSSEVSPPSAQWTRWWTLSLPGFRGHTVTVAVAEFDGAAQVWRG